MKATVKTFRVGPNSLAVIIPSTIRDALNLKPNEIVEIDIKRVE